MQIASFILDGLILVLLGATIFYAGRLSLALKTFREGKNEFAKMLNELTKATGQADRAIQNLRSSTDESGHDLQMRINQSRALSDELQLMTEAATNLADRLEKMASKNREILGRIERASGIGGEPLELGGGDFSIRDRDTALGSQVISDGDDDSLATDPDNGRYDDGKYMSRSEQELAMALRKTGRKSEPRSGRKKLK